MPFPAVNRVLFNKNPLDRVICQLRFPPILRIDAEIPASFQEKIRATFPHFSEATNWDVNIEVPDNLRGQIPLEIIKHALQNSGRKNYEFKSEDGHWEVNLTRSHITLTTNRYERWEQFKERLQLPLNALIEVYAPDYFSRVGLRYIDIIKRSALNLGDVSWDELLQPYITGILSAPGISNTVQKVESKSEIELSDQESQVRIVTGLVEIENQEICFIIDSDFFISDKTPLEGAIDRLDYFNVRSSRLIQWCIKERLYHAMDPEIL